MIQTITRRSKLRRGIVLVSHRRGSWRSGGRHNQHVTIIQTAWTCQPLVPVRTAWPRMRSVKLAILIS